jgi:hypothetical protein
MSFMIFLANCLALNPSYFSETYSARATNSEACPNLTERNIKLREETPSPCAQFWGGASWCFRESNSLSVSRQAELQAILARLDAALAGAFGVNARGFETAAQGYMS